MSSFHDIATTLNIYDGTCTVLYSVRSTFCQTAAERLSWQHDKVRVRGSQETCLDGRGLLFGNVRAVGLQTGTQTFE